MKERYMINFKHQKSCHCITIYLIMNASFWLVIAYEFWGSGWASRTCIPPKMNSTLLIQRDCQLLLQGWGAFSAS